MFLFVAGKNWCSVWLEISLKMCAATTQEDGVNMQSALDMCIICGEIGLLREVHPQKDRFLGNVIKCCSNKKFWAYY